MGISVEELALSYSHDLARILSTDEALHQQLNPAGSMQDISGDTYYSTTTRWAERKSAICYAIVLDGKAIGLISLSSIDNESKSARVGYWVGSEYWGKGYASQAFSLVLSRAFELGLTTLSCSISPDNTASLAMWKRQGAVLTVGENGMIIPTLTLKPAPPSCCDSLPHPVPSVRNRFPPHPTYLPRIRPIRE